ncbi:MAG: hypothetical protein PHN89_05490, partial [Candidatus Pacebacteria bacterium]|nr:hypothetical protein [Candidatus Paceibacterota bacterium]
MDKSKLAKIPRLLRHLESFVGKNLAASLRDQIRAEDLRKEITVITKECRRTKMSRTLPLLDEMVSLALSGLHASEREHGSIISTRQEIVDILIENFCTEPNQSSVYYLLFTLGKITQQEFETLR